MAAFHFMAAFQIMAAFHFSQDLSDDECHAIIFNVKTMIDDFLGSHQHVI